MKRIAVSADSKQGLDSVVASHFGRCPYFVLVDMEGQQYGQVREIDNPYYTGHQPGQVPTLINSLGANVMLTGGMGGRAIAFFEEYSIEAVTGAYGTVRQSVERYLSGELTGTSPCKESVEHGHGDLPADGQFEKDELGRLREEAELLRGQMDQVEGRLGRAAN